jgi:hypothetical protein
LPLMLAAEAASETASKTSITFFMERFSLSSV